MDKAIDIRLDDYLNDKLSMEDRLLFESEINKNPELRKELNFRKKIKEEFELHELQNVKSRFKAYHKEIENESGGKSSVFKTLGLIVLALGILAGVYYFSQQGEQTKSINSTQYASYFQPYEMQVQQRGDLDAQIIKLNDSYNQENYSGSIVLLDQIMETNREEKWELYRGICSYKLGNYKEALASFTHVENSDDILLKDHGAWYAALTLLELKEFKQAKQKLLPLSKDLDSDHYSEAVNILQTLMD